MAKEVRQGRYGKVVKKNEPGVCSIAWCARPTLWKGYCETHYARNRKGRDMDKPFKENHGMVKSPTHIAWTNMWQRTSNPNHRDYKYYGGRGIKVEQNDWVSFSCFLSDMGIKPSDLQLERIDNDKGYSSENCKWTTKSEQMKNRRKFNRKGLI